LNALNTIYIYSTNSKNEFILEPKIKNIIYIICIDRNYSLIRGLL